MNLGKILETLIVAAIVAVITMYGNYMAVKATINGMQDRAIRIEQDVREIRSCLTDHLVRHSHAK